MAAPSSAAVEAAGQRAALAADYDVEIVNPATNINFFWYKARVRRGGGCDAQISFQVRDASWSSWASLGGCTYHRITAAPVPNGGDWAVQIFLRGTNDQVFTNYQVYWNSITQFSGWGNLGGVVYSPVEVARNADNRLQLAVEGTDGRIHTKWQNQAGSNFNFSGWEPFASLDHPNGHYAASDPWISVTGQGADRVVEIYVVFPNGSTYRRSQYPPNCSSPWAGCWGDRWRFVQ